MADTRPYWTVEHLIDHYRTLLSSHEDPALRDDLRQLIEFGERVRGSFGVVELDELRGYSDRLTYWMQRSRSGGAPLGLAFFAGALAGYATRSAK